MSIYITGDTHIPIDIGKLSSRKFNPKNTTKEDYIIICGDFGLIWDYKGINKEEEYWIKWLNEKPWTTLFVDGNHENYDRLLNDYKIEEWHGGRVHKISNSIIHLMRGQIFNINNLLFFTMGGAKSHDKEYRIEKLSWWPEELPSYSEYNEALENLDKYNWNVDYIITHCISYDYIYQDDRDQLRIFFKEIENKLSYKHWYCGHYHLNKTIDNKHTILYDEIMKIQ